MRGGNKVAVILGSGIGGIADEVEVTESIPYSTIPGFPAGAKPVAGHTLEALVGRIGPTEVVCYRGRLHLYQGHSAFQVSLLVRHARSLGCDTLVITNASGGISRHLSPGSLVLITDHINLTGTSPLCGVEASFSGDTPFISMRDAYDRELIAIAHEVALGQGLSLVEGVYACMPGPQYETPAEVAMLAGFGADVVGMSTVPEVIQARAYGMRVLGVSLVTNVAAGVELSHDEVLRVGEEATRSLSRLLVGIIEGLFDAE